MSDEKPNLYQRMNAVMRDVAYVKKDATIDAGGGRSYKGVSHDAVTAALRPALIKHGIVVHVNQTSEKVMDGKTAKGYPKIRYEAWYDVALINMDNPADRLTYQVHAHAEDGGDKAPGKAISYAVKSVLLKAFTLETGENDESRFLPDEPAVITDDQFSSLMELIDATNTDMDKFCQYLKINKVDAMPAAMYERAMKALKTKLSKQEETV